MSVIIRNSKVSWCREMSAEDLKRARKTLKMSQEQLTLELQIPSKLISNIEFGDQHLPAYLDFAVRYLLIRKIEGVL